MSPSFSSDLNIALKALESLPSVWDGRAAILEMKEASYQWRQMEWAGFYFEYLCAARLRPEFTVPGETFGATSFDAKRSLNWDFKWHAIKSHSHTCILNDKSAMEATISMYGEYGAIIALSDVEYNDVNRTFQKWHSDLKGGLSRYERERRARTAVSRYRKTRATLAEIVFVRIAADDIPSLGTMRQGRNADGAPRPEKYMMDLEAMDALVVDRLVFPSAS